MILSYLAKIAELELKFWLNLAKSIHTHYFDIQDAETPAEEKSKDLLTDKCSKARQERKHERGVAQGEYTKFRAKLSVITP